MDTLLVRSIVLKTSQQNLFHLMVSFSNHHCLYSLVHVSSIKSGTEVVEDFSLCRIEQRFRFCYHWRGFNTALVLTRCSKFSCYRLMINSLGVRSLENTSLGRATKAMNSRLLWSQVPLIVPPFSLHVLICIIRLVSLLLVPR